MPGVNVHYTGHSTREASTSTAADTGLYVKYIMEAADWVSSQTFERFYHRKSTAGAFARAVLTS